MSAAERTGTRQVEQRIEQARRHFANGEFEQAQASFNELCTLPHEDTAPLYAMAELAGLLGDQRAAVGYYRQLTANHPDNAGYQAALAQALLETGQHDEGEALLRRMIKDRPDTQPAWSLLGRYLSDCGDPEQAAELLSRAIELKPRDSACYTPLALALSMTDRHDEALKTARKLLKLEPGPYSYNVLIRLLIEAGDLAAAQRYIDKALKADRHHGPTYLEMSYLKKYGEQDRPRLAKIEKLLEHDLELRDRALIGFALGKMYDDIGDYDEAFCRYREANTLMKPATDQHNITDLYNNTRRHITRSRLRSGISGSDDRTPVFIVGMPRSGTTLMQQIIASHPQAETAGELLKLGRLAGELMPPADDGGPGRSARLDADSLQQAAADYLATLRRSRAHAGRIVDKLPDNYSLLGLVHLLFPNATIIHAVRDPLDTCLSCYFQPFANVRWSFELDRIARQYRAYRKAMEHWYSVLPAGRIIDIRYEDLVDAPETAIRELVTGTGLDWDDACLDFHANARSVNTASMVQVRQGLYASSNRRWKHYAGHIAELANGIREYLDEEDIATFADQGIRLKGKLAARLSRVL